MKRGKQPKANLSIRGTSVCEQIKPKFEDRPMTLLLYFRLPFAALLVADSL